MQLVSCARTSEASVFVVTNDSLEDLLAGKELTGKVAFLLCIAAMV